MILLDKAVNGVIWNTLSKFSNYGLEFIVGVILARLLDPSEFGIVASIIVIIAFLEVFVNSGYSQALIREKSVEKNLYSSVFWFNIVIGILAYLIVYLTSDYIAIFFNNSTISSYIKVLGSVVIINSISLVQRTILTKKIDFKTQTIISITASIFSGVTAIYLANTGYGIWSLVMKILIFRIMETILLWLFNRWVPSFVFDVEAFKRLTKFANRLLISGTIDTLFKNANYVFISKFFSPLSLGLYTRAEMFKNLPSQNLTSIVTAVSYPVLASIQDDHIKLTNAFRRVFNTTYYLSSLSMFILLGIADTLISVLLGEKWMNAVPLLQLLCLVGLFNPVNSLCANLLNVVGRSDKYLQIQIVANSLLCVSLACGYLYGIEILIICNFFSTVLAFLLFGYNASKFIDYKLMAQIKDMSRHILLGAILCIGLFSVNHYLSIASTSELLVQMFVALGYTIFVGEVFQINEYKYIKRIALKKFYG